jgi:hypothetical protein
MSSQSVSSRVVPANRRPTAASFVASVRRVARVMWRSYERHSLYEVMLAAGDYDGLPREVRHHPKRADQN